jgi:hypothetical protein
MCGVFNTGLPVKKKSPNPWSSVSTKITFRRGTDCGTKPAQQQ